MAPEIQLRHIDRHFVSARRHQIYNRNPGLASQIVAQRLAEFFELPFVKLTG